jgi:hypothetical protein
MESIDREAIVLRNLCYINTGYPYDPEETGTKIGVSSRGVGLGKDKVETPLDAGYFYAPYIPHTKEPFVLDPKSFCPRKGILTRYGRKILKEGEKFYQKLSVKDFIVGEPDKPDSDTDT